MAAAIIAAGATAHSTHRFSGGGGHEQHQHQHQHQPSLSSVVATGDDGNAVPKHQQSQRQQQREQLDSDGAPVPMIQSAPYSDGLLGPGDGVDPRVCLFLTLHHPSFSPLANLIACLMAAAILISCFGFVIGSMSRFEYIPDDCPFPVCVPGPDTHCTRVICKPVPIQPLKLVETITVAIFTFELFLRLVVVHAVPQRLIYPNAYIEGTLPPEEPPGWKKTLKYATQPMSMVDFLSILPYYLSYFHDIDRSRFSIILRLLRVMRVFRIFKLGRYTVGGELLQETIKSSASALGLLAFFAGVICLVFSSIIFYMEIGTYIVTEEYPEGAFLRPTTKGDTLETSPFASIPVAAYFVMVTATTLGYGDITPASPGGRAIAVLLSYLGIIGIALPSSIIAKTFFDSFFLILARRKEERRLLEEARAEVVARAAAAASGPSTVATLAIVRSLSSRRLSQSSNATTSSNGLCCLCRGGGGMNRVRDFLLGTSGAVRRDGQQDSLAALAEATARQRAAEEAAAEALLDEDDGRVIEEEVGPMLSAAPSSHPPSLVGGNRSRGATPTPTPTLPGPPELLGPHPQRLPSPGPLEEGRGMGPSPSPLLVTRSSSGGASVGSGSEPPSIRSGAGGYIAGSSAQGGSVYLQQLQQQRERERRKEREEKEALRHRKTLKLAHALREQLKEITALYSRLEALESVF